MTAKKMYLLSLGAVMLASAYPIYMGAVMLWAYMRNGGIDAADYPSYIIPYTPICLAFIVCTALLPLAFKWCKKFALPALSLLGIILFLVAEIAFEQVTVFSYQEGVMDAGSWQSYLCIATPEVMQTLVYQETVGQALAERYSPVFKIHFYAISILIVLAVIGLVHGFYKMARTRDFTRKKPLTVQLISVTVFIGLCILACFTAFFRTGEINISPLSAVLMTLFFLVFGITAGVYAGTCFYEKRRLFSAIIPSTAAMALTVIMYIGEMMMMGGELFRMGSGFLFVRMGAIPFAPVDIMTILASGAATYLILTKIEANGQ
ncbi:MAG: hypothetical protein FWE85_03235 [Clostridiales bacterium]|nr:hypothetical protein [Clostridiales bacterium]